MAMPPAEATTVSAVEIQASQIIERLEEAVEKATDAVMLLEQSGEKNTEVRETDLGLKGESWSMSQGFLQPKGRSVAQIMALLEDLIVFENNKDLDEGEGVTVTSLAPLSSIAKAALVAQSIGAFASTLDRSHLNSLHNRIHNDTTRWLTHLFRFYESYAFYHEEPLEGLVRLTRMLLHSKYPTYFDRGFHCLAPNPPVIYAAPHSSLPILHHLCRHLGLSLSCLSPLPAPDRLPSPHNIDVASLQRIIQEDKAAHKVPLLLLADAGTPITGHVDDLARLQDICRQEDVWLHVRGHGLATLAAVGSAKAVGDSMSLSVGTWLGVAGLPTATLFRGIGGDGRRTTGAGAGREATLPLIAGLAVDHMQKRLVALPLWFALQGFGRDEIQQRIRDAFEKTHLLWEKLSKYSCLRLLSQRPGGDSGVTVQELMSKPVTSATFIFEVTASTVVFQFVPEADPPGGQYTAKVPPYYNKLNSWLGQILQQDVPQVNVEICELDYAGVVLRICPLEAIIPIGAVDVDMLTSCLEQQLEILLATVRLKSVFQRSVEGNRSLRLVEMEGWAGLGGVRYVPEYLGEADTPDCMKEVNKLNVEIVTKLRATDAAFSLGEGADGLVCIRFGMVTAETDVEELLSLVTTIGKDVEESSKYLDTMVEIVKKGIQTATMDLQKENEERLWQEGILRHVPVFGTLVNWWSPKSKETGIKGRSLNLQAGVVESTENIYRYHMQLQQGASSPPGTKSPPVPLVQTPIVTESSSRHSRSSSHCSQVSQKSTEPRGSSSNNNNSSGSSAVAENATTDG